MPTGQQKMTNTAEQSVTNGQEGMPYGKLAYLPNQLWDCFVTPYTYETDWIPIPAGESVPLDMAIQSFAHFAWDRMAMFVTQTNNTTVIALASAPLTLSIVATASGRDFSSGPVPVANYCGTGQLLFDWEIPALLHASETVSLTLTNLDGGNAYNVRLSAHGYSIYGFDRNGSPIAGGAPPNLAPGLF